MLPLVLSLARWPFKLPARILKPSDEQENYFFCIMTILTKITSVTNMALVTNISSMKNITNVISATKCDRGDKV